MVEYFWHGDLRVGNRGPRTCLEAQVRLQFNEWMCYLVIL